MPIESPPYRFVNSKTGDKNTFASREDARTALRSWIKLQRTAGEPVIEQATGQWSDSRVTVWISDANDQVIRLAD